MSADYTINVGPATCDHRHVIADAVARHDFPGLPSISELEEEIQKTYLEYADYVLNSAFPARPDNINIGGTD